MNYLYTIGVDFGTDSVRILIVNVCNGHVVANAMCRYSRWGMLSYCDPENKQFRQHPLDHIESLKFAMRDALSKVSASVVKSIAAMSIATTGSTPVAINKKGIPLSLTKGFEENPNAMFLLWKDHCALQEANEINALCHSGLVINYTKYSGGEYSSEWFWAKILHVLRHDEAVRSAAYSWVEHCDWISALLTGVSDAGEIRRSRCAAGHKAMWHPEWGGLPSNDFLVQLDPLLEGVRDTLYRETFTSDHKAGRISEEWAEILGLPNDVVIGVGSLDAHMGAIGGEIKPNQLIKVIGTSTCDMMIVSEAEINSTVVQGICGQVEGSILPGMVGLEAGQSAFGDIYAWLRGVLCWPIENVLNKSKLIDGATREAIYTEMIDLLIPELSNAAENLPIDISGLVAIDWMNGRRTPNSNQNLKGGIVGLNLGTDAPKLFRAMVEATAFGSKKILDCFNEAGIKIDGVIAVGGVAQKSDFVMQILSDVLNCPIQVVKAQETCALGAAMAAAVVVGAHDSFANAQSTMGCGFQKEYKPIVENAKKYRILYNSYSEFASFIEWQDTTKKDPLIEAIV